jgi:hypothetical protein
LGGYIQGRSKGGSVSEDKLEHDERLRLEALNQAVTSNMGKPASSELILHDAKRFEKFIKEGKV